jgi:hypothetical protein
MSQPGAFVEQPGQPTTSDADGRASRASTEWTSSMGEASGAIKDYDIVVAMRRGEAVAVLLASASATGFRCLPYQWGMFL